MTPNSTISGDAVIAVDRLVKIYEGREDLALNHVSFQVLKGECFGLLGPNGAGKTTLMGCLIGLLNPEAGNVSIYGLDPCDMAVRELIGFMPERPNFESWMSAREFVAYHHALAEQPAERRKQEVEQMLTKVGLDRDAWDRRTNKFSRGMLQRLGLAQALIGKPSLLFLDEPGSGMDPPGVALLRDLLAELKRKGMTVVLNSHHLDEMERVCDRVAFIRKGRIEAIKTIDDDTGRAHVLKIKLLKALSPGNEEATKRLEEVAKEAGTRLIEAAGSTVRILVEDGAAAARLIREMVAAGVEMQSASPESTSLERLFEEIPELVAEDAEPSPAPAGEQEERSGEDDEGRRRR